MANVLDPAALVLTGAFPFQSYLDNIGSTAIQPQAPSELIVGSTRQDLTSVRGRCIGLHPASQTPVAVKLAQVENSAAPGAFILTPGQVYVSPARFTGISWGLPLSWLGGGTAQLVVSDSPHLGFNWPQTKSEVIFHRQRMVIDPEGGPIPFAVNYNWPVSFPWMNAVRNVGAGAVYQGANPIISVEPTRVLVRLNYPVIDAPTGTGPLDMRFIIYNTLGFDLNGVTNTYDTGYIMQDLSWPSQSATFVGQPWPTIELVGGPLNLLGGPSAIVQAMDTSGTGALIGQYVDIIRFGKI